MVHKNKGMITVETLLSLSMFMIFMTAIIFMVDACLVQAKIQGAIDEAAKEISIYSYLGSKENREYDISTIDMDNYNTACAVGKFGYGTDQADINVISNPGGFTTNVKGVVGYFLGERNNVEFLEKMGIEGGLDGLDFSKSTYNLNGDGDLTIVVTYEINLLRLPFFGSGLKKKVMLTASTRLWRE